MWWQRTSFGVLALAGLLLGCSGAPSDVTGTRIIHYVTSNGVEDRPADLSGMVIGASVTDSFGNVTFYPGVGAADGTFTVPAVPEGGRFLLQVGTVYVVTSAHAVDLDSYRQGPATPPRGGAGTSLHIRMTDLAPWQGDPIYRTSLDTVQMYAPNANFGYVGIEDDFSRPQQPGSTILDTTLPKNGYPLLLLDATKGDQTYFAQLTWHALGGSDGYRSLGRFSGPHPLTIVNGQTTEFSSAFTPVPQTEHVPLDWPADESAAGSFLSFRTAFNPKADALEFHDVSIQAAPPTEPSTNRAQAYLAQMSYWAYPGAPITIDYGDPYPSDWTRSVHVFADFEMEIALPGQGSIYFGGGLEARDTLDSLRSGPLKPKLSPVTAPTADGATIFEDHTLGSLTPTIRWSPPAVGRPTYYTLSFVNAATITSGGSGGGAYVVTADTQLKVPLGMLESGGQYVLYITAWYAPEVSPEAAPFRRRGPVHSADCISALLTAP